MAADSKRVAASDQRVQQRLVKCGRLEKGLYIFGREVSPCPEALALFASWPWRLATWLKNRRRSVGRRLALRLQRLEVHVGAFFSHGTPGSCAARGTISRGR